MCWDGTCCARGGCRAGLRLRPWWQAVWFDVCVVSSLAACVAPNWGVASLRRVLCGWPALVGWRFLCVCAFDGFLLWVRIAYACPTIASLCNKTCHAFTTRLLPESFKCTTALIIVHMWSICLLGHREGDLGAKALTHLPFASTPGYHTIRTSCIFLPVPAQACWSLAKCHRAVLCFGLAEHIRRMFHMCAG